MTLFVKKFVPLVFKRWWLLVIGIVGGGLTGFDLIGVELHMHVVIGISCFVGCLFVAVIWAAYDIDKQSAVVIPRQSVNRPVDRRLSIKMNNEDSNITRNLSSQMHTKHHYHTDDEAIEKAVRMGIPTDIIMNQPCTQCGKPRNKKGVRYG
jgi:hypothetical protein